MEMNVKYDESEEAEAMFCQTCGNKLEEGSVFCMNCGAKVVQAGAESEVKSMSLSEEPKVPVPVTGSENAVNKQMIIWRLRIIVAAVASILCMYIQNYFLFSIRLLIPDIFIILSVLQFIIKKRETLLAIMSINIVVSGIILYSVLEPYAAWWGDFFYYNKFQIILLYFMVVLGAVQLVLAVVENNFKKKA